MSHFFYDNDAVLLCDWSLKNARHILRILRCFFLASSLIINLQKSKLIGVGVSFCQVEHVVGGDWLCGCQASIHVFGSSGRPKHDLASGLEDST